MPPVWKTDALTLSYTREYGESIQDFWEEFILGETGLGRTFILPKHFGNGASPADTRQVCSLL
jgi:hypothetical protein